MDAFFSDEIELLPLDYTIECGQIKNFVDCKPFEVMTPKGKLKVEADSNFYLWFDYYYEIWDNWRSLKILPHGKGWIDEQPWLIDFIKFFDRIDSHIEAFIVKRGR